MRQWRWLAYDIELKISALWFSLARFRRGFKKDQVYDSAGWACLHRAVMAGNLRLVKELLSAEARPDLKSRRGELTALHLAARAGWLDICRTLLEYGANPNAREYTDGLTPLHLAIETGEVELVALFLRRRANPRVRTRQGENILDWARSKIDDEEIEDLLREALGWRVFFLK